MSFSYDRAFVERQIAAMPELEAEELSARLREVLGDDSRALVDAALAESDAPSEPALARVLDVARAHNLDSRKLLSELGAMRADAATLAVDGLKAFQGLVVYTTLLTVILLFIILLFATSVLPQFETLFTSFGTGLPPLTRFMLHPLGQVLVAGVPLMLVLVLWLTLRRARQVLTLRVEPRGWLYLMPFVRRAFLSFRLWVLARIACALAASGADAQASAAVFEALDTLKRGSQGGSVHHFLMLASQLGTLTSESRHWVEVAERDVLVNLAGARDRIAMTVQLGLGVIAGLMVIAMYLPLFVLGSAV